MKAAKTQSLIEYILTLTLIVMSLGFGAWAFSRGVQRSNDNYQRGISKIVNSSDPIARYRHMMPSPYGTGEPVGSNSN